MCSNTPFRSKSSSASTLTIVAAQKGPTLKKEKRKNPTPVVGTAIV